MERNFKELAEIIGKVELDLHEIESRTVYLKDEMTKMSHAARLAHLLSSDPSHSRMRRELTSWLTEIERYSSINVLEDTNALDVLVRYGHLLLPIIQIDDVPEEDEAFLRECGIKEPAATIRLIITLLNSGALISEVCEHRPTERTNAKEWRARILTPHAALLEAIKALQTIEGETIKKASRGNDDHAATNQPRKPKKIFNGIGKIISGTVTGTGNVLIGVGAIPASGGAATAGLIASSAIAFGLIMGGIGDLRGE